MSRRSGWCSPAFGTCESQRAHATCQHRIDTGQITRCDCAEWGGHDKKDDE